jgi:hypothetical protein
MVLESDDVYCKHNLLMITCLVHGFRCFQGNLLPSKPSLKSSWVYHPSKFARIQIVALPISSSSTFHLNFSNSPTDNCIPEEQPIWDLGA